MRRSVGMLAMAALAMGGLVGCDPPAPRSEFAVNSAGPGTDAAPGDGVCETAPDNGECTFAAALQEADLAQGALILLTDVSMGDPLITATITGDVIVRGDSPTVHVQPPALDLTVGPGGALRFERIDAADLSLRVQGSFVAHQSGLYTPGSFEVEPTGSAILLTSLAHRVSGGPLIENSGQLLLLHSTIASFGGTDPLVVTGPGGTTSLAATRITSTVALTSCGGQAPVSLGYNAAVDSSCGLDAIGDQPNSAIGDDLFLPFEGSTAIDAIPQGTLGCGDPGTVDVVGASRPFDGDGDGTAACDIGAWEWNPAS